MANNQVISITFFRYEGVGDKWWAFKQMGLYFSHFKDIPGLQFFKMFGSGGGNGFSFLPNFSVYGLLCTWDSEEQAGQYFSNNDYFQTIRERCAEHWTIYMRTAMVHGSWDGQTPFDINHQYNENELVGVITRATIKTKHLWRFWSFVPAVSRSIIGREGLIFTVGIGEIPYVMQVTFSLWENSRCMKDYAYKSKYHKEVVRQVRKNGWFREELFARMVPFRSEGSWLGKNPLKAYL